MILGKNGRTLLDRTRTHDQPATNSELQRLELVGAWPLIKLQVLGENCYTAKTEIVEMMHWSQVEIMSDREMEIVSKFPASQSFISKQIILYKTTKSIIDTM